MNVRMVPSEFTPGAYWIYVESRPEIGKLSKSEKPAQWFLVSSWSSKEFAEAACEIFRGL